MLERIQLIIDIIRQSIDCEKIFHFGSYACGTPTDDSDFDFYVAYADDCALNSREVVRQIYKFLVACRKNNSELWDITIDIFACRANFFDKLRLLPTLTRKIATKGILMYERQRSNCSEMVQTSET